MTPDYYMRPLRRSGGGASRAARPTPAPCRGRALLAVVCAAAMGARGAWGLSAVRASDGLDEAAQREQASAPAEAPGKLSGGEDDDEDDGEERPSRGEKEEEGDDKDDKEGEDEKDEGDKPSKESEDDDKKDEDEEDGQKDKDEKDDDNDKEGDEEEKKRGSDDEDDNDKDGEVISEKAKAKRRKKDSDEQNDKGEEDRADDGDKGEEKDTKKKEKNAEGKAELLKDEKKPTPRKTTNEKGEPIDPGCYVLMPDGCPGKSWGPTPWKRDVWGEANVGAGNDKDVCENKRKIKFNKWCGKDNARMLFNEGPPPFPAESGCFYWHPTGCPAHDKKPVKEWVKDESDDGISQAVCEGKRKAALDKYCGISDTKTLFMHPKPETPEYPGCYVWMPNGCALHKFDARKGWKRDAWGEDNGNAGQDKAVCEKRKLSFNTWCGIGDTQMLFVESKE